MQSQRNSKKSQVGNRKAGSRKQQTVLLSKKEFMALGNNQRASMVRSAQKGTRPLGANSTSVAAAYSAPIQNNRPKITYGPNGKSCRVQHKEFIQNVSGTPDFTVALFLALNPGLAGSFPWLSNIANNFEQYRVNKMRFCYLTRTGTNIPGSVLMAPDYDASDVQPVSEQIMSNYAEIVEDAPWKDICCLLRPSGMHALGPKKFVRSGLVPGQDLKTTDVGTFILATVDGTAVNWGKLWVEYDVEFFEPQLNPQGSIGSSSVGSSLTGSTASLLATGPVIVGPLIASVVGNVVSLQNMIPNAEYFISSGIVGNNGVSPAYTALVGITLKNPIEVDSDTHGLTFIANATSGSITITLSGASALPVFLFVGQIPLSVL